MKLIVFVGPKQSGKDASAKILKDLKTSVGNISFASPLKRVCTKMFDMHSNMFSDNILKEKQLKVPAEVTIKNLRILQNELVNYVSPQKHFYNINSIPASLFVGQQYQTPREALQTIGSDLIRNHVNPNWHCLAAFSELNLKIIDAQMSSTYCVTDCRFLNEYEYLKANHDCLFFYVERPEAEAVLAEAAHQSELEVLQVREKLLADGGFLLGNTGTLEDLTEFLKTVKAPESTTAGKGPGKKGKFKFKTNDGKEEVYV